MSRIAIAVVLLSASVAAAEPSTKVFPLTGQRVPKARKDLPDLLTRTVAKSVGGSLASAPIEDAADLMMCKLTQTSCLKDVAKKFGAQRIVFGVVTGRPEGGVTVRLSTFDKDAPDERTYVLTADTNDELAAQLARNLDKTDEDDEPVEPPAPPEPKPVPTPLPPPVDEEPAPSGKITGGTWAMIIGGGVTALVGTGIYVSSKSLKAEAARLPTDTRNDIDVLLKYESAGRLRANIGVGLAVAGGAVAVVGIVRAVMQKGEVRKESPTLTLAPEQGGASVFYARSW
jgi:hypothetical protein